MIKFETNFLNYGNYNYYKKNKPAYKALILLAREFEKNDHTSISINEKISKKKNFELILPKSPTIDPFEFFAHLSDFPLLNELRKTAWPKVS
jgi:hypothetical protein